MENSQRNEQNNKIKYYQPNDGKSKQQQQQQ